MPLAREHTAADAKRLRRIFAAHTPDINGPRSDDDLMQTPIQRKVSAEAAVLVPLVMRPTEVTVLLTKRSSQLNKHAGQIAFPGGRLDPGDKTPESGALRETWEEVGIASHFIEPIGRLDTYKTVTGYIITPVVGLLRPQFDLRLSHDEVEQAFEVPLDFFLNRANHKLEKRMWRGEERAFYAMPYRQHYIWGATAAMMVNLVDILEAAQ